MRERIAAGLLCGAVAAAGGSPVPVHEVEVPVAAAAPQEVRGTGGLQGFVVRVGAGPILTPAVAGRRVFAGSGAEMRAFDAITGRALWTRGVDDAGPTAPAVLEEEVYFNTASCTLYALDVATGARKWSRWIAGTVASTPAVSGGLVFVTGPAKEGAFKIEAYAAGNGGLQFARALPADVLSAPVVAGDRVFLALAGGRLLAYDLKGRMIWEKSEGAMAAPWPHGERLLVACGDGNGEPGLRSLDAATGASDARGVATPSSPPKPAPASPEKGMFAGGGGGGGGIPRPMPPATPDPRGDAAPGNDGPDSKAPPGTPTPGNGPGVVGAGGSFGFEGPRPCVLGTTAALAVNDRLLLQPLDGGEAVRVDLGAEAAGAPAAAGSLFVQATRDGRLLGFDPATGERRFEVRLTCEGKPVPLAASPAVWRGRAYVGTADGSLVVIDLPDPSADGWPMWGGSPQRAR